MNILFWNLYGKNNNKTISELLDENNIDIALFSEYTNSDMGKLENSAYVWNDGLGGCQKITLLARKKYLVEVRREHSRYTIYSVKNKQTEFILVGVHLIDRRNHSAEARVRDIIDLIGDVTQIEKEINSDNTIIIGDFNANPFDKELIGKYAFNAVIFRSAMEKEVITYNSKRYRKFYNPILSYWADAPKKMGTVYNSNCDEPLYWNNFDQILIRKPLINSFISMEYCDKTSQSELMAKKAPNKRFSDHLPLIVRFSEEGN